MLAELSNTIATLIGIFVALLGAFLFAFWIAMGIWTFNDIRSRTRDWLAIVLASLLVLVFPLVGLVLYMMVRPRETLADVFDRALEEESLLRELESTLACYRCGMPVQDHWNFCSNCHRRRLRQGGGQTPGTGPAPLLRRPRGRWRRATRRSVLHRKLRREVRFHPQET